MLVAGQRVADQDGVGAIRIQRAIGFIADLDRRQQRTAIQPEGPGRTIWRDRPKRWSSLWDKAETEAAMESYPLSRDAWQRKGGTAMAGLMTSLPHPNRSHGSRRSRPMSPAARRPMTGARSPNSRPTKIRWAPVRRRAPHSPPPPIIWNAIRMRARPRCARRSVPCMGSIPHGSSMAPAQTRSSIWRRVRSPGRG